MPLTAIGDQKMLGALFGGGTLPVLATSGSYYLGLTTVKSVWTASTAFSSGDLVIPTAFNSSANKIFRCTTAGTTASSEPTWPTTASGTVSDGTAVWTEITSYYYVSSQVIGKEVSGGAYSRQALANTNSATVPSANWLTTTLPSTAPATTSWNNPISFTQSTAAWGTVAGFFLADASTSGNVLAWGTLSSYLAVGSAGITVTLPQPRA